MKLKSGMLGAGIVIPGCTIDPLPVVVDIIKGMENGTEGVKIGHITVEPRYYSNGYEGDPDITVKIFSPKGTTSTLF